MYARAMAIRARLALCTAAVVSIDGEPQLAQWMLLDLGEQTADAFGDLVRRLGALAREDPGWTWVPLTGCKELQASAMQIAGFLEDQIAPQLPARTSDVVEFNLQMLPE